MHEQNAIASSSSPPVAPGSGDRYDVTQIALGRFHHFHLARQMERYGRLREIWTGYPRAKLRDEPGVPQDKVRSYPWFYVPSQLFGRLPLIGGALPIRRELHWQAVEAIDRHVAGRISTPTVLIGLSSGGLRSGRRAQALGGRYVCDRGSTHIRFQDDIMREEFSRWKVAPDRIDPRVIAKEEAEYEAADRITIPSMFCHRTFVANGIPAEKLQLIPYGGRIERFFPVGEPDRDSFNLLFVGGVSLRKGIPYLLQAFARLAHPRKKLTIIGSIQPEMVDMIGNFPMDHVELIGAVPNTQLPGYYSRATAMVLPSIEEGLGMVMAEAMACGCPVIASENSGAHDLFDETEGILVPIRSVDALLAAFERLAGDPAAARALGERARLRIQSLGGYDSYGANWEALLTTLDRR